MARPVVATRAGGLPEVVADGETGLLVPKEDPAALAEKIEFLLDNPGVAQAMGQRGRRAAPCRSLASNVTSMPMKTSIRNWRKESGPCLARL